MKLFVRTEGKNKAVPAQWLRRLSVLVIGKVKGKAFEKRSELSIVLAGDREVRELNKNYRKKDKTTDVLSFPLLEGKRLNPGPAQGVALGDVVISVPQAKRQAAQQKKRLKEELALLLVHGILHLLGYDHVTRAQEKRMFGLQDRLLRKFKP